MSDNPFATPPSPGNQGASTVQAMAARQPAPGALTTILVLCLILGIFGLLGVCATGAYLGFQSTIEKMVLEGPGPLEQKEFQRMNLDVQKKVLVPSLVLAGINFFVATMLIVGSIGGLTRKASGRGILRFGLLLAIFYLILKIIVTIYTCVATVSGLNDALANYKGDADPGALENLVQFGKIGGYIGAGFGLLFPVAILIFYVWARNYLNKDKVIQYFGSHS